MINKDNKEFTFLSYFNKKHESDGYIHTYNYTQMLLDIMKNSKDKKIDKTRVKKLTEDFNKIIEKKLYEDNYLWERLGKKSTELQTMINKPTKDKLTNEQQIIWIETKKRLDIVYNVCEKIYLYFMSVFSFGNVSGLTPQDEGCEDDETL